jgi:hypothetical protein
MRNSILIGWLIVLPVFGYSQSTIKLKEISCPEKWWVLVHPFVAIKAVRVSHQAQALVRTDTIQRLFGSDGNGGGLDAFRHSYWMASLSKTIGERKALKLGLAHEKGNKKDIIKNRLEDGKVPDNVSIDMDLHNNAIGVKLASKKCPLTKNELVKKVHDAFLSGTLVVIKKDEAFNSINASGKIIPDKEWQGNLKSKRVLIPSNCY